MRPSSNVPSSVPTVKRTQRVPGTASGHRCEVLVAGLVERRERDGGAAAVRDAHQPRRLGRRDDDRAVGRPRRAARIAADVRQLDDGPAADRHLGELALPEERQPSPVRREERLPGAVGARQPAQRRIAQLAQIESPRPAIGRLDGQQRPVGGKCKWRREPRRERQRRRELEAQPGGRPGCARLRPQQEPRGQRGQHERGDDQPLEQPAPGRRHGPHGPGTRCPAPGRGARCGRRRCAAGARADPGAGNAGSAASRHAGHRDAARSSPARREGARRRPPTRSAPRTPAGRSASRRARSRTPRRRSACRRPRPSPAPGSCSGRCRRRGRSR